MSHLPDAMGETNPQLRVTTTDRERTGQQLGQALALGAITITEYEDRLDRAMQARTADDVHALLADLPLGQIARDDPGRTERRRANARRGIAIHAAAYLGVAVLTVGIWLTLALTVGGWYPWPIWPILGGGLGLLGHAIPVLRATRRRALPSSDPTALPPPPG
jgi:hypothetical protein